MKKHLLITCAICVLFLSVCGSVLGTSTPSSNVAAHTVVPVATASTQSVCQVLHDRQAQLNQEYHAASVQLASAQAGEPATSRRCRKNAHQTASIHRSGASAIESVLERVKAAQQPGPPRPQRANWDQSESLSLSRLALSYLRDEA